LNPQLKRRIEQIRRRWWVVLAVAAIATTAAALPMLQMSPTYVGKSLLVQSSQSLAPEQNATMAIGYATLFNEPETIGRLKATHNIPENVTFEARTVAASPILTIQATADNPTVAQDAAENMAKAFRDDINSVGQAGYEKAIADAEAELKTLLSRPEPDGKMNPLVPIVQTRLDTMHADSANQLQNLQLRAGVIETQPSAVFEVGKGAAGGLLLGILAALGLAALSQRLVSSDDLVDKTGIEPLVEVPGGDSIKAIRLREDRLRTLANIVSLQDLPKSAVVALTDCRGAQEAEYLAESVARLSAQKGYRTVLVYANNDALQPTNHAGFNDALVDSSLVNSVLIDGAVDSLKILPAGSVVADRYPLISRERIDAVLDELRMGADTVVIAAPPIADTIESQTICAAADFTMLVVGRRSSRSGDVSAAADALANAHAVLLGAVMVDGQGRG
jgi:succinoglycan biosynthesis transport protein ExoP